MQKDAPDPFPTGFYSKVLLKSRAVTELPGRDRGCGPAHGVLQGLGSPLPARCIPSCAPGLIQPSERPRVGRGRVGRGPGAGRLLLELIAVFQGVLFPSLKPGRGRRQLPGVRGSAAQSPAAAGLVALGAAKCKKLQKKKWHLLALGMCQGSTGSTRGCRILGASPVWDGDVAVGLGDSSCASIPSAPMSSA